MSLNFFLNIRQKFYVHLIITTAILSSLLFMSCDNTGDVPEESAPLMPLSIKWNKDNSIVCLGTSITNGKGWGWDEPIFTDEGIIIPHSKPDSSYPELMGRKLRIKVYNQGIRGGKIKDVFEILEDSVLAKKPVLVILEMGANEFLSGEDADKVETRLDSLIKSIKQYRIKIVFLSFYNPDMLNYTPGDHFLLNSSKTANQYYNMFKRVTKSNHILMDDYILRDIWGRKELMSDDSIHPNNKGNAKLANNIFHSLVHTFRQNNMIKQH